MHGEVDVKKYRKAAKEFKKVSSLKELEDEILEKSKEVGIDYCEKERAGSFFQIDHSVVFSSSLMEGVEVMLITDALKKYDWLKNYYWKAVKLGDEFTREAEKNMNHGYFIRTLKGVKATLPIQACLFLNQNGISQNVHNIIIAEEDSELNIITGCTVSQRARDNLHIGISEFYVKKNAKIGFTMIHSWSPETHVRPRSAAIVEENGAFISTYLCLKEVKSLQMYPTAYLNGKNAKASFSSLLLGLGSSKIDVGSRIVLNESETGGEIVTRAIAKDSSHIFARGHLLSKSSNTKAHLECRGLIISEKAKIHAIPELEGVEGCDLSHEAAVGKIKAEQLYYLMSRGLSEEEAISLIVKGFLTPEIKGLPSFLKEEIKRIVKLTAEKAL